MERFIDEKAKRICETEKIERLGKKDKGRKGTARALRPNGCLLTERMLKYQVGTVCVKLQKRSTLFIVYVKPFV